MKRSEAAGGLCPDLTLANILYLPVFKILIAPLIASREGLVDSVLFIYALLYYYVPKFDPAFGVDPLP